MNPEILRLPSAEVRIFPDTTALTRATAAEILRVGAESIAKRGRFDLALAGGSTPRGVYRLLAEQHARALAWENVHLFFGDERHVPPAHPDSNYRMALESLLANPAICPQVHRIEAELPAKDAASRYEAELRTHFKAVPPAMPTFDLILLGLGIDGHTASLFPGTAALAERHRAVVATSVPQLATERITLTYPCINQAREILFLTAGADKATMLANILRGDPTGTTYPAQSIQPASGRLLWMTDEGAATALSPREKAL